MNTTGTYKGINYLLHTPTWGIGNGAKQPLIIFLHGIGERGNTLADVRRLENNGPLKHTKTDDIVEFRGTASNFYVLAPQLPTSVGNWTANYTFSMLEFAKANLDIDVNRIYLMGLSLGGGGVYTALQDVLIAPQIAAATVCCGTCQMRNASLVAENKIPVFIYHSVDDPTVPISCSEKAYDLIINAGGDARIYRLSGYGHNVWDIALNPLKKAYKNSKGQWAVNGPTPYERSLIYAKTPPPVTPLP